MSLALCLKEVRHLPGRHNRIVKVTFRDKAHHTDVFENCCEIYCNEEFEWPVSPPLKPTDFIEIQVLNYSKILRSRLVGSYQMYLKKIIDSEFMSLNENLVDRNNTVIQTMVSFELIHSTGIHGQKVFDDFHKKVEDSAVENWDLESKKSQASSKLGSLKSSLGSKLSLLSRSSSKKNLAENDDLSEVAKPLESVGKHVEQEPQISAKKKEISALDMLNMHPKVHVFVKQQREETTFTVQIRVIEAKQLAGTQLDPICEVLVHGETKHTQTKEQTANPYWDEFFVFDLKGQPELVMDEIMYFKVFTGRNVILSGDFVGSFKIDIGTVYAQPDHRFVRKYALLTNPDESVGAIGAGIKGYLKLDITVLARGDPMKEPPAAKDGDEDVDENPLLPENVPAQRVKTRMIVKIYKAEGLPKMNSGIIANVRKHFTGETKIRDLADPFVEVSFAGYSACTSVKKNRYEPKWNEQITICDLFPSLCRRIKIQMKDKDATGDEIIGTHWIDLSEISNDGANVMKYSTTAGFMPTFGPCWVNFYGSTRDFTFIDQNNFLNEGLEEGIGYRGRLLMAVQAEPGDSASDDQVVMVNVAATNPISDLAPGKEDNFQLFCCIHEASMIDRKTAANPIQFEMTIGYYGNTIDGKMLSTKDDDDDEEKEDIFTVPLTPPVQAETLHREYYHLPYYESKPCMHIKFPWEDQRWRLYLQNMIYSVYEKLVDQLVDVEESVRVESDSSFVYLRECLSEFIANCKELLAHAEAGKITGPRAGRTKLDHERLNLCISEVKEIVEEASQVQTSLTDNSRVKENMRFTDSFKRRLLRLTIEPQHSTPDVFLWLLSGGKRHSYVRIPANTILYSTQDHELGKDCGKLQTYFLKLPGKSGLGKRSWAIQCKLSCMLWLGIHKNKKDMFKFAPTGFDLPYNFSKMMAPPPSEIKYKVSQKVTLRAHLYQARGLIGSDASGLSDAMARVVFFNQAGDTSVVHETRNPTWNQTIIFYDVVIWGDMDSLQNNPPTVIVEIFDEDPGGDLEFIGRTLARPLVKRADEPYEKPVFPPCLEWFQIYRGNTPAGELLAAFELFQIDDEGMCLLPNDPEPLHDEDNGGTKYAVPSEITPTMAMHRIECLFWGVREMKKLNMQTVDKPQAEMECIGESVKSTILQSAKKNSNFEEPWAYFDLMLPDEPRYCPPLSITLRDYRFFGKNVLVGTHIINSLYKYIQDPEENLELEEAHDEEQKGDIKKSDIDAKQATPTSGSKAGSRKGSVLGSKAPSMVPSKRASVAGSATVGSRPGRNSGSLPPPSILGSRKGSDANEVSPVDLNDGSALNPLSALRSKPPSNSGSRRSSKSVTLEAPGSNGEVGLNGTEKSIQARSPAKSEDSLTRRSSQIHYHIRSGPGGLDAPAERVFTPKASPTTADSSKAALGTTTPDPMKVTPFKVLRSQTNSPAQNLPRTSGGADTPSRKSVAETMATPLKSLGSKLASPVQSLLGTPTGSKQNAALGSTTKSNKARTGSARGSLSGSVRDVTMEVVDGTKELELAVITEEAVMAQDETQGQDGGEKTDLPPAGQVALPIDDEQEAAPVEEDVPKNIVMIGEDEVKQQMEENAAAAAEADEEKKDEDDEDEAEDEDPIDWWSRFYETIKDKERAEEERREREKARKKALAKKKGKAAVQLEDDDREDDEEDLEPKKKKKPLPNPRIVRLKIYEQELEERKEFSNFNDVLRSFPILRGKSSGNDDDDESRIFGKFKGALKVWKFPVPSFFDDRIKYPTGSFRRLPSPDPVNLLCRVYVIRGIELHPTDLNGKADPYVQVSIGSHKIKDRDNYVPKNLSPSFGRVFDLDVQIPRDNMLTVGVYDYDMVGSDDLIGQTKIDIENRFFSKHRPGCGMSVQYSTHGFNKWRDPFKPVQILQKICKEEKLDGPHFSPGKCRVSNYIFCAPENIVDENGNEKASDEPSALKALHNFHMIPGKGFHLVPEHVETRSLFSPEVPGMEQGRIQMWVDLFEQDGPAPEAAVDIAPRKPAAYEMRVIIWNTEDVVLGDINILTGQPCADIYVKGWIAGLKDDKQQTDIHGTSLTGEGNFNWRFIFPFKYHKAEEKIVITKKASLFSWDESEEKMPPRLILQCWDSDALSSDDFLGDVTLDLTNMPYPAKSAPACTLDTLKVEKRVNIFKFKKPLKGWWPFVVAADDKPPEVVGKVEAEIELLTQEDAEQDPAGRGRKDPHALAFPNRPDVAMTWLMNPFKALRYMLWEQYKFCLFKFLVIGIIFAIMGLFFYSMPGYIVKKLFGA